ncbi:glycosyltransferase [Pseudomonas reactans]|uniref:glycosyltransferase n=1 Tax=Pseudomonas reactans TaxID=117680 RepID=UPI0015A28849|nr:glycosyltransferase [Pseudomonas reactans]NWC87467.1 glycosyltransferase [Pseudomonas reactans]NWD31775.1 glycosyltransferase [Pseudomonas reactans]NWF15158.1 glycosyltransferase [Pseudomonas reactans]
MKILHFYKTFAAHQHGGVEMFIRHLTHATSRLGCENVVLSLTPDGASTEDGPDYRLVHAKENFNLASTGVSFSSFKIFSELSKSADIVHYHFPWPFMDVVHFATRVKKPTVVTYHSDIVRQKILKCLYSPLQSAFLNSMDAIVATSPNYLESSPVLARYRDKSTYIPIGLEESMYPGPEAEKVEELQQRHGRFFLFVGVLRYYKGLKFLLQAIEGQGWPLLIVGGGPLERDLMQMAAERNLHNVQFIGQVSEQEKVNLIHACYAVVFPSHLRSEAFGISLLEAAMFGKPMICSEIGTGTSFINQHGVSGLVVPPRDALAMRVAMRQLWESSALAAQYGKAARVRYLKIFTSQSMGDDYMRVYSELARSSEENARLKERSARSL